MVPSHVDPTSLLGAPLRVSRGRTGSDVARRFELLVDDLDDLGAIRDGRRLLHVRAASALAELDRSHGTRIWYNATLAAAVSLLQQLPEMSNDFRLGKMQVGHVSSLCLVARWVDRVVPRAP